MQQSHGLLAIAKLLVGFRLIELGRHMQPPDTFRGSARAQQMSFFPAGAANSAPPNPLAGFEGHFEEGERVKREEGEGKGKEVKGETPIPHPK